MKIPDVKRTNSLLLTSSWCFETLRVLFWLRYESYLCRIWHFKLPAIPSPANESVASRIEQKFQQKLPKLYRPRSWWRTNSTKSYILTRLNDYHFLLWKICMLQRLLKQLLTWVGGHWCHFTLSVWSLRWCATPFDHTGAELLRGLSNWRWWRGCLLPKHGSAISGWGVVGPVWRPALLLCFIQGIRSLCITYTRKTTVNISIF